jgi:hypothetical protein
MRDNAKPTSKVFTLRNVLYDYFYDGELFLCGEYVQEYLRLDRELPDTIELIVAVSPFEESTRVRYDGLQAYVASCQRPQYVYTHLRYCIEDLRLTGMDVLHFRIREVFNEG